MSKYQKYGNIKMRGRKHKLLSCGCCEAINKRKLLKEETTEILYGSLALASEIDREVLENLMAGEKNNTEDTLGYSEGNWEDYIAFKKKREESMVIPNE